MHYSMPIRIISHNPISYIMTSHTTNVLSFQDKGQYKDDYYQLSQFQIRYLYLARAHL